MTGRTPRKSVAQQRLEENGGEPHFVAVHGHLEEAHPVRNFNNPKTKEIPRWIIWSEEHGAWWAPDRAGYTRSLEHAGRYLEVDALEIEYQANRYLPKDAYHEFAMLDPLGSWRNSR